MLKPETVVVGEVALPKVPDPATTVQSPVAGICGVLPVSVNVVKEP